MVLEQAAGISAARVRSSSRVVSTSVPVLSSRDDGAQGSAGATGARPDCVWHARSALRDV